MRAVISGCLAIALSGCAGDVRDRPLAQFDLANPATLAALREDLPIDDRGAFATYALLHWPGSRFYCGTAIGGQLAAARTVGEAIEQTRAYEVRLAMADQGEASEGQISPRMRGGEAALINRVDRLVLERDMARSMAGASPGAAGDRVSQIETELETARAELAAMRR